MKKYNKWLYWRFTIIHYYIHYYTLLYSLLYIIILSIIHYYIKYYQWWWWWSPLNTVYLSINMNNNNRLTVTITTIILAALLLFFLFNTYYNFCFPYLILSSAVSILTSILSRSVPYWMINLLMCLKSAFNLVIYYCILSRSYW